MNISQLESSMSCSIGAPKVSEEVHDTVSGLGIKDQDSQDRPVSMGFILKIRKFFHRHVVKYGMFCQDTVAQATFVVPQFVVWEYLSRLNNDECTGDGRDVAGRFQLIYDSQDGRQTVTFNMAQIFSACRPFYNSIAVPINLLIAAMVVHHLFFFTINILKVG